MPVTKINWSLASNLFSLAFSLFNILVCQNFKKQEQQNARMIKCLFFHFFVLIAFSKFFSLQPLKNLAALGAKAFQPCFIYKAYITYCFNQIKKLLSYFQFSLRRFSIVEIGQAKKLAGKLQDVSFLPGVILLSH